MSLPQEKSYTFADLLEWEGDSWYKLYNGQLVMMSPPLREHQEISGEIYLQIGSYLKGKACKVYHAPFGVRLFEAEGDCPYNIDTFRDSVPVGVLEDCSVDLTAVFPEE